MTSRFIGKYPKCTGTGCYTILFQPRGGPVSDAVLTYISQNTDPPLNFTSSFIDTLDVRGFDNETALEAFIIQNQNLSQSAISFESGFYPNINVYSLYVNHSLAPDVPYDSLIRLIEMGYQNLFGIKTELNIQTRGFPVIIPAWQRDDVVNGMGVFWFYCPPMVNMLILLTKISQEKELNLRHAMTIMGLKDYIYWISWFLTQFLIEIISTSILIVTGITFQFAFFVNTDFWVNFSFFLVYSVSLIPLAFLLTTLVSTTATASLLGFLLFVIGLILQMLFKDFPVYLWYKTDPGTEPWKYIFMFYPPFNFAKLFSDINYLSTSTREIISNSTMIIGNSTMTFSNVTNIIGYQFSDLFQSIHIDNMNVNSPPGAYSLLFLLMDGILFYMVMFYFDQVMPSDKKVSRPFYFLLMPSYWASFCCSHPCQSCCKPKVQQNKRIVLTHSSSTKVDEAASSIAETLDSKLIEDAFDDVSKEMELATNGTDEEYPIRILGLKKSFLTWNFPSCLWNRKKPLVGRFQALKNLYLAIKMGQCFCFLGPNGVCFFLN